MLHKKVFADLGGFLSPSFTVCAVISVEFKEHIHVRTLHFLSMDNWYDQVVTFQSELLKRHDSSQQVL